MKTLQDIAEQEVDGMKVRLDVGVLRHQVERIREQPKINDKIVVIVGSMLTALIIMRLLVFCREKKMLRLRKQVNRWRKPPLAERSELVIRSEEILGGNGESRGGIEVKTSDRSWSTPFYELKLRQVRQNIIYKIIV